MCKIRLGDNFMDNKDTIDDIFELKYPENEIKVLILDSISNEQLKEYNDIISKGLKIYCDKVKIFETIENTSMLIIISSDYNKNKEILERISKLNIFTMLLTCNLNECGLFDSFISYNNKQELLSDSINIIESFTRMIMIPGLICMDIIDIKNILEKNGRVYHDKYIIPMTLDSFEITKHDTNFNNGIIDVSSITQDFSEIEKIIDKIKKYYSKINLLYAYHVNKELKSNFEINLYLNKR